MIYNLNRLAEYSNYTSDLKKPKYNEFLDNIKLFFKEYYLFREYIEWFIYQLDEYHMLDLLEEYDDELIYNNLIDRFDNVYLEDIKNSINIWTAIFCIELGIDHDNIIIDGKFSNNIFNNNINSVDKALGDIQIQCCLCYTSYSKKKYDNLVQSIPRIRKFRKILSKNNYLKKEYLDKKSIMCYSQMWIDKCDKQYFDLSCSPAMEKTSKYYEIVNDLLNLNQNHSKYKAAL